MKIDSYKKNSSFLLILSKTLWRQQQQQHPMRQGMLMKMILNNFNKSFAIELVSDVFFLSFSYFSSQSTSFAKIFFLIDVLIICLETLNKKEKDSPFVILSSCS